jgi:hypothetical protein
MTVRELPGRYETLARLLSEVFHSRFQSVDLNSADTQSKGWAP